MMRGKQSPKRSILPDPKYSNVTVAKFTHYLMRKGKKSVAQKIVYGCFDQIQQAGQDPMAVFDAAIRNVSPILEVKSRRIGGANFQVPIPVRVERKMMLASRWIIEAAKSRKGQPMAKKLAQELTEASQNQGTAIKKKTDVHRMAEANRAFAHFAR
ncbi:30S ribosomal protein S7 [Candidatus Uhrbacteria bacterium]|nr:30S ribosomal protein S7 [Candidatus Uhrbacteria bacterium]